MCIDGVQPTIPENPPPVAKDVQKLEAVDPVNKVTKPTKESSGKPSTGKQKLRNVETVQIKQLATHELSVEQQLYYKEITEACVGSDEARRAVSGFLLVFDWNLVNVCWWFRRHCRVWHRIQVYMRCCLECVLLL